MENTENLKKTVFNEMHREMGAKMVPFAGFDMPVQFEGVNIEHETVRKGVGVFDVSHMGEFRAKGPKAFAFVQRCTTNDVAALTDGKVQYTCLPNGKGGIVDDMLVYRVAEDEYFMVPNAANIDKDWAWMSKIAEEKAIENIKTLTAKELCQRWNISDNTLRSKENAGIIHPLETGGKKKIYSMKDIKNVEASGFIKGVC